MPSGEPQFENPSSSAEKPEEAEEKKQEILRTKNRYGIPFDKEALIMAVSDPRVHFHHAQHAIDFILPEGTEIIAPEEGTVVEVKVDSKEGGADPRYNDIKYLNYIVIEHNNEEYSEYGHLQQEGALVKVGDKVKRGQPIAISGNTGFTTHPHLHFQVFRISKQDNGKAIWETLKVRFREKIAIDSKKRPVPESLRATMKELERVRNESEKQK